MTRSLARALGLGAALAMSSCSQNGSYRLSWTFYASSTGTGPTEVAAAACGQHGVDSILATGSDQTGDAVEVRALCTPGWFTGTAALGTWTFQFQMLDVQGMVLAAPAPTQPGSEPIASSGPPAEFAVTFIPPSACAVGVQNAVDGSVDGGAAACDAGLLGPVQ